MKEPISIQIIGAPVACEDGVKDVWPEVANWAKKQLHERLGEAVRVEYLDLFDPACPPLPSDAQLPFVMLAGETFSSGGKISVPAIRRKIENLLNKETI